MQKRIKQKTAACLARNKRKRRWKRVVGFLACIVVFCAAYALIRPATTLEKKPDCGRQEHEHLEKCYKIEDAVYKTVPVCTPESLDIHSHTDACLGENGTYCCGYEDYVVHEHDSACNDEEGNLWCQLPVCADEGIVLHTHTSECYDESGSLICALKQVVAHQHNDSCFKTVEVTPATEILVCGLESHQHVEECFSDSEADVEDARVWEGTLPSPIPKKWDEAVLAVAKSQLGYVESSKNYTVDKNGNKKGYTRYGQWYGDSYGDWCAMFVSFCLDYAGVKDFPLEANCARWVEALKKEECGLYHAREEYEPEPGDLVFFDWDGDMSPEHIGLAAELIEETDTEPAKLRTIEGNSSDCVQYVTYNQDDTQILGYGELPQQTFELSYKGEDYTVQVSFTREAKLPENVEISARELTGEEYEESCRQAKEAMGVEELSFARFFDVSFTADGEIIEPAAPVDVKIIYDKSVELKENQIKNVVHFTEKGTEILDTELEQESGAATFAFTQSSFSVTGTVVAKASARAVTGAPPVGAVEGIQVREPVVGEWYIIYNYAFDDYWNGFVLNAQSPASPVETNLTKASITGGPVEFKGSEDVVWKYTEKGFMNRNGQYLKLVGGSNEQNGTIQLVGANEINENGDPPTDTRYNSSRHALYSGGWDRSAGDNIWNYLFWDDWNGRQCRTVRGSIPFTALRYDKPTYIARVTTKAEDINTPYHPQCAITGDINEAGLEFFNIDGSGGQAKTLSGVEYTIWSSDGTEVGKYVTGDSYMRSVGTLPDGSYYIEQTNVPDGYAVVPQHKEFTVSGGKAVIGVFYDYKKADYKSDKTAEVVDYDNRTYKVDLSSKSGKYVYELENENYQLIVDQSNSMLFPAKITPTGDTTGKVTLNGSGKVGNRTNSQQMEAKGLRHDKLYYLLTDEDVSSTIYAVWYDNISRTWLYQDAAYYSKAMGAAGEGNNTNDGTTPVKFAVAGPYNEGVNANTGGGSLNVQLGNNLWKDCREKDQNGAWVAKSTEFVIYEGSDFNRLHYLQESMLVLINQLASLNKNNTVSVITFDKVKEACNEQTLSDAGVQSLMETVNSIKTAGGTRPNAALDHANNGAPEYHQHIKPGQKNNIILITDGAPVSSEEYPASPDDVRTAADAVKSDSNTLITIGLSMQNVKAGSTLLKEIATGGAGGEWWFQPDDTSDLANILMRDILTKLISKKVEDTASNVRDVISDSFYPINPDTNAPLAAGTWIGLDGHVIPEPTEEQKKQAGQVVYDAAANEWSVEWNDQTLPVTGEYQLELKEGDYVGKTSDGYYCILPDSNGAIGRVVIDWGTLKVDKKGFSDYYSRRDRYIDVNDIKGYTDSWHGTVYLKAKEDFIGGNAIDTNKSATITLKDTTGQSLAAKPMTLPTPTVNVRLLPMNLGNSEETVFLGDKVNPQERIQSLMNHIKFSKIVTESGDAVYNRTAAADTEGLEADSFTLAYAIQEKLTDEQWEELFAGNDVKVDYTYDEASSHGAVGYFTLSLKKAGAGDVYTQHNTTTTGKDVETYTLKVTYTAYKLGEEKRPGNNVHNSSGGPGTEVRGKSAGNSLETGKGTLVSENVHKVHVVDGKITVIKEIEAKLKSSSDQTFAFTLQRQKADGTFENVKDKDNKDITLDVIVKANQTTGTATLNTLPRGTYRLVEASDDRYNVRGMTVVDETNCLSAGSGTREVTFTIGTDADGSEKGKDVIQEGEAPVYSVLRTKTPASDEACRGVSYGTVKVDNEKTVYTAEIPVEKKWHQVPGSEYSDITIYVALYQNDAPVKDVDGHVLTLALNKGNSWQGSFKVALESKDQDVAARGYSIRELEDVTTRKENSSSSAVLVNDNNHIVYYESAVADGQVEINGASYSVSYKEKTDTAKGTYTLSVTNSKAYRLPDAGGFGTTMYTMGGLLLIVVAGILLLCRKRAAYRLSKE